MICARTFNRCNKRTWILDRKPAGLEYLVVVFADRAFFGVNITLHGRCPTHALTSSSSANLQHASSICSQHLHHRNHSTSPLPLHRPLPRTLSLHLDQPFPSILATIAPCCHHQRPRRPRSASNHDLVPEAVQPAGEVARLVPGDERGVERAAGDQAVQGRLAQPFRAAY